MFTRQISNGPALISEFNPLADNLKAATTPAQEVEQNGAAKLDANLL